MGQKLKMHCIQIILFLVCGISGLIHSLSMKKISKNLKWNFLSIIYSIYIAIIIIYVIGLYHNL